MAIHRIFFLSALILGIILPGSAQAADTPHWVHYKLLLSNPKLPKKVIVLPTAVEVIEVTAGDVKEEVPEWSKEASKTVIKSISAVLKKDTKLTQVATPRMSGNLAATVDEHLALYKLVVNTAAKIGWDHKVRRFDYSIGPGLSSLARKTGADAAIMVYAEDYVSTAGRKTKAVLGNIPIINWFTGAPPKLGHSFIHIGVIDLKTGDLLWMNSEYRDGASNLREYDDAHDIVKTVFDWYPGIEKYRDVYVK